MNAMEREGYEVAVYTYRPGTAFAEHQHAQDKCDAVLEGILRITVGEEVFNLQAGDRLYLPAGTRHSAEVIGRRTVLSLDGTLGSRSSCPRPCPGIRLPHGTRRRGPDPRLDAECKRSLHGPEAS